MALPLQVTIAGTVAKDVVQVLVGGVVVPLTDGRYETTVNVSQKIIAITAIDNAGHEWTRSVKLSSIASTTA